MALPPLAGFTVAVTADRRQDEQVELLRRRGADVVVAPTIRVLPLADDERVRDAIERVIAAPPDVTVLLTGVGTRGLISSAESLGRDGPLLDSMRASTVVARGPKAAAAGVVAGLTVDWCAPSERTAEVLDRLRPVATTGARIVIQRDGGERALAVEALRAAGADAVDLPVYRWALPEDAGPALRLVDAIAERSVDAVTFTSAPAVNNLLQLAAGAGRLDEVLHALGSDVLAVCVGPVCAEAASVAGITRTVNPTRSRLGAMVQALVTAMKDRTLHMRMRGVEVALQGAAATVDGCHVRLSERERAVLHLLLEAGGVIVPKRHLLRDVWRDEVDEHAVEVTVARLRKRLGPAGHALMTVPRRGYRLDAAAS